MRRALPAHGPNPGASAVAAALNSGRRRGAPSTTASFVALAVLVSIVLLYHGGNRLLRNARSVGSGSGVRPPSMQDAFARLHSGDGIRGSPVLARDTRGWAADSTLQDSTTDARDESSAAGPAAEPDANLGTLRHAGASAVVDDVVYGPEAQSAGDATSDAPGDVGRDGVPPLAVAPGDAYMEQQQQQQQQQQDDMEKGEQSVLDAEQAARPRLSRHPVLFPALREPPAGAPPLPEDAAMGDQASDCEPKWGNSWLRGFAASRTEECLPSLDGAALDADALRELGAVAAAAASPGWRGGGEELPAGLRGNWTTTGPRRAVSRIAAWRSSTGSNFHWMRNVALDFSQLSTTGDQRQFGSGFITASCAGQPQWSSDRDQPALGSFRTTGEPLECSEWVTTPTVVIQHDDIGNTYHNLADFWRVWLSLVLLQQPTCVAADAAERDPTWHVGPVGTGYASPPDVGAAAFRDCPPGTVRLDGIDPDAAQVMTMDGRIMCNTVMPDGSAVNVSKAPREDCFGPYFPQYPTWFGRGVVRAREYGTRRVCFSALGWAASTPESHIWDKFSVENHCTRSPILARYAEYVVERWGLASMRPRAYRSDACRADATVAATSASAGAAAATVAPEPPADDVAPAVEAGACRPFLQVAYVARRRKPFSASPVARRVVANEAAFLAALRGAVPGADVRVVDADFTLMPYAEQVALARASHVLIGMHGAGMTHGIHMAPSDECGGGAVVIELFPNGNSEKGVRNMNMQVGRKYLTWRNPDPAKEVPEGTIVDTAAIAALLREAAQHNAAGRTC